MDEGFKFFQPNRGESTAIAVITDTNTEAQQVQRAESADSAIGSTGSSGSSGSLGASNASTALMRSRSSDDGHSTSGTPNARQQPDRRQSLAPSRNEAIGRTRQQTAQMRQSLPAIITGNQSEPAPVRMPVEAANSLGKRKIDGDQEDEPKKRKISGALEELWDGLKGLGFHRLDDSFHRTFHPQRDVAVTIRISNGTALQLRIVFSNQREWVTINDGIFAGFSTEAKIERVRILSKNCEKMRSTKEASFPMCPNWGPFITRTSMKSKPTNAANPSVDAIRRLIQAVEKHVVAPAPVPAPAPAVNTAVRPRLCSSGEMHSAPIGYPSLSPRILHQIDMLMRTAADNLVNHNFGIPIYGRDIHFLRTIPLTTDEDLWLNDQIINFYMKLLAQFRALVRAMDTFFWERLRRSGCEGARDRNVDMLANDVVLVPIHRGHWHSGHWSLAVVLPSRREINYYDSNGRDCDMDSDVPAQLEAYIRTDFRIRHGSELDTTHWTLRTVKNIPRQNNRYDCGVFVCAYAESIARNQHDFKFTQEQMPYFRKKIAYEIATGQLLN